MFSGELSQLDPPAGRGRHSAGGWGGHLQQRVREMEGVAVTAPERVPIDLCGVPVEGRDGHVGTVVQDGAPSGEITRRHSEY